MQVTVHNRGPEAATLHLLPQLWFRNTWSWKARRQQAAAGASATTVRSRPSIAELGRLPLVLRRRARAAVLRERDQRAPALRAATAPGLFQGCLPRVRRPRQPRGGESAADRHQGGGALPASSVPAGGSGAVRLRLSPTTHADSRSPTSTQCSTQRRARGRRVLRRPAARTSPTPTRALVQRQAFAGMIWSKQFYYYDVPRVAERRSRPAAAAGRARSTAATASGSTSTTPTSSRCRTSGSIRGTPRGTWRSTASRWR